MANPFSLYLHIPFCKRKCAYCSFYSAVFTPKISTRYIDALTKEIKEWGGRTDRPIDTIYFGGGTPSLINAEQIKAILDTVYSSFTVLDGCEITFEVNPENSDEEYFNKLYGLGINRLSIGLQTASDASLKLLGRNHSCLQAESCFYAARKAGFKNISLDLMLCIPNSSIKELDESIALIKKLDCEHVSAYMLILEEHTAFFKNREKLKFFSEDQEADIYLYTCKCLKEIGFEHYEISNFCKKGYESRHNTAYWLAKEYIGIGPSAYSYFEGNRFHYENDLRLFLNSPNTVFDEKGGDLFEFIMLNLRLSSGLRNADIKEKYNKCFSPLFYKTAEDLKEAGLAEYTNHNLWLTEKGMLISNSVINQLVKEELYENI